MKSLPVSPLAPPKVLPSFLKRWTTWSVGWTSNPVQQLTRATNDTLRLIQKTSGLFNEGQAGDDRPVIASDNTKDLVEDFLAATDNGNEVLMWGLDDISLGDMLGSDMDPMGEASLDSFVDLSTYLMENTTSTTDIAATAGHVVADDGEIVTDFSKIAAADDCAVVTDVSEVAVAVATTSNTSLQKRSFERFEVVDVEDEVVNTSDHDYVSKKSRLSSLQEMSDSGSAEETASSTFISPSVPEVKYRQRRDKNNIASRRSRESKKQKFTEMEVQAEQLKIDNEKLKTRIVELEKLAKEMKATLVAKLAGK